MALKKDLSPSAEERAERAELALKRLMDLTLALSSTASVDDVAELVVDHALRGTRADTATLYVYDEISHKLVLIAHRGVAPEIIERIRIVGETEGNPDTFESFTRKRAVWNETAKDYASRFPDLAGVEATGPRAKAFWSMPLVAEGRAFGLLGVGYYEEQTFAEYERALIDTFTKQCAQALVSAQHREREVATRQWLATTLESIGDAVIATDTFGRITFMNAIAGGLTGWSQDEARGKKLEHVFDILSEETRTAVESPVRRVLREGGIVGLANHT
ncbi:MAG: GAF domain-containing protein, partial [Polyangiaceae bacterium]